jgi:hypothetical protein
MIADDPAFAEMYDGYGIVARESELIALTIHSLLVGDELLDELPRLLRDMMRRAERIHAIAAAERERWA